MQGFHDFVLFSTVAFASLMSGRILAAAGWETMNMVVFPVVALCLTALAIETRSASRSMRLG